MSGEVPGPDPMVPFRVMSDVAISQLELVAGNEWWDAVYRLGQAMGLLSHLAYNVLDLQNPDTPVRSKGFMEGFARGVETGKGVTEMLADPTAVSGE